MPTGARSGSQQRTAQEQPARLTRTQLRTSLLGEVVRALDEGATPFDEVLPAIFPVLQKAFAIDAALAYVLTAQEMTLSFVAGLEEDSVQLLERLDFGQAICGTVVATGKPLYVSDIQRSLDPRADLVRAIGISACVSEPLIANSRVIGTLSFGSRRVRTFDVEDLLCFREIAALVSARVCDEVA